MATEAEIRDAERARLEAIVAEHGTEREQSQLVLSGVLRNGITLAQLEGTEPVGYLPPEPEFLARLSRRVERRAKLGLPPVECAGEPPTRHGCKCLERALEECEGGKRAVHDLAASLHWSPPPRTDPTPSSQEPPAAAQETNGQAVEPIDVPRTPPPEPEPASEKPHRVVHRTRKWFDDSERPRFWDTKF